MTDGPPLPLLLVGPVTVDVIDGQRLPGGPVSYGARVAESFGIRARILTIGGADTDRTALEGHDLAFVEDAHTLTFEIDDRADGRLMRVPEQPTRPLSAADLPDSWAEPGTVMIAPLLRDDLDLESLAPLAQRAWRAGIVTQGLQRKLDNDRVMHLSSPVDSSLIRDCSHSYTFFRSEREAALWTDAQRARARGAGARLVTTQGARGALVEGDGEPFNVDVFPTETVVDATGAGDVFATALILALDEGERAAAEIAAAFAAASVEQIGPAPLPSLSEIRRRVAAERSAADEQMRGARA